MEDSNTLPENYIQQNDEDRIEDNVVEGLDASDDACDDGSVVIKKRRRMTSKVWGHFEMLPNPTDGKQRCKCKRCGAQYLCDSKNGTGNLRRHLQNCKKRDLRDIGQLILQTGSSASISMIDQKFDNAEFRDLFTACIIMHDLPFQCVEWMGVRSLMTYLRRDVQMFSRNTARNDCKKLFTKEVCNIRSNLSKCTSRVSITSDLWTSINTDGFICLTVHYIDNEWHLHKKIISFSFMPPPHDGIALCEKLQSLFLEWKIESKLFSVTLDNASANNVCVDYLRNQLNLRRALLCEGQFFHIRCTAHIVNLIVQEGMKEIDVSISKIRESIKYVKGSQARKQKFLDCVKQSCLESKRGLRQDVPTRWNSTFIMLESALYYRRAFQQLELGDSNFKTCPVNSEWERVEKISTFLKPFYDITKIISGTKYPTANLYFPCISTAYATLKHELIEGPDYIKQMCRRMIAKFEKYWHDFSVILAIAVILDPRYKFAFVEWCYKRLYVGDYVFEVKKVKDSLFSLFSNYATINVNVPANVSERRNSECTNSSSTVINSQFLQDFDSFEEEVEMPKKSELELYLDEPKIDRKIELDILHFWKANQYRFPEVSAMARDVLCIPISTVASESAFSNSGRILDQYRSALKHDIVEALVCAKDWLYGDKVIHDPELEAVTEDVLTLTVNELETNAAESSGI
ncbi:hypothetical protein KFK09_011088 [Dendrobium nobile]|uniref:BED-type domain-containing protein n=1 Tax=Dendrobium nobile TaxID=94219 RepID=A0A8T3BBW2_DENNO|nr:hypothetical protein KFK09_011088 [Dendrobium nobile]